MGKKESKNIVKKIASKFEIEKRIREKELYKNGAKCINGECSLPVFFTYKEIIEIIKECE